MFYHQKVARVRVFADIQNFALRAWLIRQTIAGFQQIVLVCAMYKYGLMGSICTWDWFNHSVLNTRRCHGLIG